MDSLLTLAAETGGAHAGGEANLHLPDVGTVSFMGIAGDKLLMGGLGVSALGMLFGIMIYAQLKKMPVHKSMLEISELIYATCKSYMIQQGKFLMLLWVFIAAIVGIYFGKLVPMGTDAAGVALYGMPAAKVAIILGFSLVGIAGSYAVAWFGIRVNTFANSRAAFAALRGKPFPCYSIPLKAGMSIGMALISVELLIMLGILLFVPGEISGACLIGFASLRRILRPCSCWTGQCESNCNPACEIADQHVNPPEFNLPKFNHFCAPGFVAPPSYPRAD